MQEERLMAHPTSSHGRGGVLRQLWFWVLIAIGPGARSGWPRPTAAKEAKWLADAFLQLVKTITAPVIFLTVVIGIASLGNMARAGGLAPRALGYFFVATVVALGLGLLAGNLIKPGAGFDGRPPAPPPRAAQEKIAEAGEAGPRPRRLHHRRPAADELRPAVRRERGPEGPRARDPRPPPRSAALAPAVRERVVRGFEVASQIVFGVIRLIMWAAPLGAFGGMAFTVAQFGGGALQNLALLLATFWGTAARLRVRACSASSRGSTASRSSSFVRLLKDELLIILGTSSSETVLPRLLAKLERAGASRQSVGVVLPTGYSFNLDGTCIYLTLGALFIVQASGQDMAIGEQIALAALMVLTSKGAAGITGAGLVTLTASLQAFGGTFFSAESIAVGIALVVGIDRMMCEGRALTNCIGNGVATMVIATLAGRARRGALPGGARRPVARRSRTLEPLTREPGRRAGAAPDRSPPAARSRSPRSPERARRRRVAGQRRTCDNGRRAHG